MSKKPVYLTVTVIVLMGVLGASFNVHKVEAPYPIIYIKADGSIDPSTANITSSDNVTYTFTADINASIYVERSHIVVNGNGYTLLGPGSGVGVAINLFDIRNVTIKNVKIRAFNAGIILTGSGVYVGSSSSNTITGNNITDCNNGIILGQSLNNTLSENRITGTMFRFGIEIHVESHFNTISGNHVTNNSRGITVYDNSNHNLISGTNITNNGYGILLENSSNNTLYHNNFIDNTNQAYFSYSPEFNIWDNGVEGNYWSNYTGVDLNRDGIGDSWYNITQNNLDHYPLMGMFSSFNTSLGQYVDVISNSTIEDFEYFESNSTIILHVSNMTAKQTHGFCRISIPYEVMSEPFTVTIDGANPTYWNYTLYDNGTHRWIYFAYDHSTREIIIVPEFPSFLVLPLFMIATLLAVIVYRRQLKKGNISASRRNF